MNLYDIDRAIEAWEPVVDEATGEVLNFSELDELNLLREQKLENVALYVKNLTAEAAAIRAEELALAQRRKAAESKADRLRQYLSGALLGERFDTPKVTVSFRRSETVTLSDSFIDWAEDHGEQYLRYKAPEPDKTAIKEALKNGVALPGAALETKNNIQIK